MTMGAFVQYNGLEWPTAKIRVYFHF